MPDPFFPLASCVLQASELQDRLAGAKVRLFKSSLGVPPNNVTLAQLEAAECDYTGYAEQVVAAWLDPLLAAGGGAQITAATKQFQSAAPFTVSNIVGGYWIEFPAIVGPPAVPEEVCVARGFDVAVTIGPANTGTQITPTVIMPHGGD